MELQLPGADGKPVAVSCRIDELAGKVRQLPNPERMLELLCYDLRLLQNECSGETLPPLGQIYLEVDALYQAVCAEKNAADPNNRKKALSKEAWDELMVAFGRNVQVATKEFESACRAGILLDQYLRAQEKLHVPPEIRYYYRLRSLDGMEQLNRNIWPDVNNYLDGLEKEYIRD